MTPELFNKHADPELLAEGSIEETDGRRRVCLTARRLILSGTKLDLSRAGDQWELRRQPEPRQINHAASYDALCPWESDERESEGKAS